MNFQEFAEHLRTRAHEMPREMAQQRANQIQDIYDRVLVQGNGRSIDEVRSILAREWLLAFGENMPEPNLSENAAGIAAGNRIEVILQIKN